MARLDAAIELLMKQQGAELIFETGTGAYMNTPAGPRPVIKQALTAQQIIGAFSEIVVPPELKDSYPAEGDTDFAYRAPSGGVIIRITKHGETMSAFVQPVRAEDLPEPVTMEEIHSNSMSLQRQEVTLPARPSPPWMATPTTPTPVQVKPIPAPAKPVPAPPRSVAEHRVFPRSGSARELMNSLLVMMLEQRASDLHISSGSPPMIRVDGDVRAFPDMGVIETDRLQEMLFSITPERNQEEWNAKKDTDFAHETEAARFRVNVFQDRNGIGAVMRQIPNRILTAEELNLPPAILEMCKLNKGLVVVTGPTGSGKSTTLAAMVDYINRTRDDHIITIEDPIEFVHPNKKCLVNQREIGVNTQSFKAALRAALREDPDIVLVGEMRDLETVAIAIETAETGHLVFGTLHTNTAASTVDRIIDQFPTDRQEQIRLMLSESLRGVVAQTLCKKIGGGRVAALEILVSSSAVGNLIREGKTFQIPSAMQTGRGQGMATLNDALLDLVKKKLIEPTEAYAKSLQKVELKAVLERAGHVLE